MICTAASDGVARSRATISVTLATMPPVTSTPREPPSACASPGSDAGRDLRDQLARWPLAGSAVSTPATSPTRITRCGLSRGASQAKISSVEMIVPPRLRPAPRRRRAPASVRDPAPRGWDARPAPAVPHRGTRRRGWLDAQRRRAGFPQRIHHQAVELRRGPPVSA